MNTSGGLTTDDCRVLFTGPVQSYAGDRCQCINESFLNDNNNGCCNCNTNMISQYMCFHLGFRLGVTLTQPQDAKFCPLHSGTRSGQICRCDEGYTRNNDRCGKSNRQ